MQITRLRLIGFKSFVEPTDLVIQDGLTGIVGPNGCGKSNLLEALRWVMGETSYKVMRASAMDDVIFSGTQRRPARNAAEVMIHLDNSARTAPAEFNDDDVIEITRRIERDAGSIYRLNGREVRARDIKVLFEDAATGARSHALVRQGQITEIVNAKPEKRRRVLEDAAGIAGLHTRRHEAELRLKAADGNIGRVDDLLGQINGQINGLKRQARQAQRYKKIAGEIRELEALQFHLNWLDVQAQVATGEETLNATVRELATATQTETGATRLHLEAAEKLSPLRDREAERAAALQRLRIEQENLTRELERTTERKSELDRQLEQLERDARREAAAHEDAEGLLETLTGELAALDDAQASVGERETAASEAENQGNIALATAETALAASTERQAEQAAEARRAERARDEAAARLARVAAALDANTLARRKVERESAHLPDVVELETAANTANKKFRAREKAFEQAAAAHDSCASDARTTREAALTAQQEHDRIAAEISAIEAVLATGRTDADHKPVADLITVEPGYEPALAAALGDALEASLAGAEILDGNETPGAFWRTAMATVPGAELPADAEPLDRFVSAPPALSKRLAQIGVVLAEDGPRIQELLSTGQRLVSRDGGLWRWDGFVRMPDAITPETRRLEMRNRLVELQATAKTTADAHSLARVQANKSAKAETGARAVSERAGAQFKACRETLEEARSRLLAGERARHAADQDLASLAAVAIELGESHAEARTEHLDAETACNNCEPADRHLSELARDRAAADEARAAALDLRAAVVRLRDQARERTERRTQLETNRTGWRTRLEASRSQLDELRLRMTDTGKACDTIAAQPAEIEAKRDTLREAIAGADTARQDAADRLAAADTALRERDAGLREARDTVAAAREAQVRSETRLEGAREKMADQSRAIREALSCPPENCLELAGFAAPATDEAGPPDLPGHEDTERKLVRLRADRERIGGVNLRADEELVELTTQFDAMETERADLEAAIAKLRSAISKLNREGRRRLLEAFDNVNGHFQRLFATLFDGGSAELKLVESDDPLEAGLEIMARPPGKKLNIISLLSGGEQTLTAISLIFAVFLTNPSPICVLDEVDAPLDDTNVDRFCNLIDEMARTTDTRFLIITHHPNTMARMNRLFGVTMAEKGVSQLVSVDLAAAETYVETG